MSYQYPPNQQYPPPQGGYPGFQQNGPQPGYGPPQPNQHGFGSPGPYQQPPGPPSNPYDHRQQPQYAQTGPGYHSPGGHGPPGPPPGQGYHQSNQPNFAYNAQGPYPPQPHSPQPPQHPQHFQPPPQGPPQGYGQNYGAPPPPAPSMPSLGYAPGQVAPGDFRHHADVLRKAMKGFGTDEKALIQALARLDPLQIAAVRATYSSHLRRDLYSDVKSETSSYFRQGLLAIIDGPLMHDTALAREAVQGIGTKEWLLNDVLLGRSNADLNAIKVSYERTYRRSLDRDVEDDLSFKTKNLFAHVLRAARHEEGAFIDQRTIESEAQNIHGATAARVVNNADEVCAIFARSSNRELQALNQTFTARYHTPLEAHLEKQFSGHMKDALLHMLRTALDPAMRDAVLLEECMKGIGTKDERLVVRAVRVHWDRQHLSNVKAAYQHKYKQDLVKRVKGETSGDYQRLLVAMLE